MSALENFSSDSENYEHSNDALMEISDEKYAHEKVTLSYFKKNVYTFSICEWRKLVVVLLDLISELTKENGRVNNSLAILQDSKISLVSQMFDISNHIVVLEAENRELKEKTNWVINTIFKGKNNASSLQLELKCKLHIAEMKIKLALERNLELERDLVRAKRT